MTFNKGKIMIKDVGNDSNRKNQQSKRPNWLVFPLELQQVVIREMTAAALAASRQAPLNGYQAGASELYGLLKDFNADLLEKGLATPDWQSMEELAGAILAFHGELANAADQLSSEFDDQRQRWETAMKSSLGELVELAHITLDSLSKLKDVPTPFSALHFNAKVVNEVMREGAEIALATFNAMLPNAALMNAGRTGIAGIDQILRQGAAVALTTWNAMFGLNGKSENRK